MSNIVKIQKQPVEFHLYIEIHNLIFTEKVVSIHYPVVDT